MCYFLYHPTEFCVASEHSLFHGAKSALQFLPAGLFKRMSHVKDTIFSERGPVNL